MRAFIARSQQETEEGCWTCSLCSCSRTGAGRSIVATKMDSDDDLLGVQEEDFLTVIKSILTPAWGLNPVVRLAVESLWRADMLDTIVFGRTSCRRSAFWKWKHRMER